MQYIGDFIPPLTLPLEVPILDDIGGVRDFIRAPKWNPCEELQRWGKQLARGELNSAGRSPGITTETVWCPTYDTEEIGSDGGPFLFFQDPRGRGAEHTNIDVPGSLRYPRALSGRGIVLQSDQPLPYAYQINFWIGEIVYHTSYIRSRHKIIWEREDGDRKEEVDESSHYIYTEPYYIPPVQNFRLEIRWNGCPHDIKKQHLRVTLMTWLLREVQ